MNVQTFDDISADFKNYLIANQDKLTDFTDGSIINTFIEAFAMQLEKFYIDTRNGFNNNLKNIIYSLFNFAPKAGSFAHGYVTFSREKPLSTSSDIPAGTRVSDGTNIYQTQLSSQIAANEVDSPSVPIIAMESGKNYNINANTINSIETIISADIVSVTNPLPITEGSDGETENEMFNRFVLYINSLQGTSKYAVQSAVLNNVPSIKKVKIEEHFENVKDTNFTIYAFNGSDILTDEEISTITSIVNGDNTKENQGIRPLGINFDVKSVQRNPINIEYKVTLSETSLEVKQEIENEVQKLFDTLDIGDTLYLSELISVIRKLSYIKDVTIITPSTNQTVQYNGINTLGSIIMNEG